MIHSLIAAALKQRLVLIVISVCLLAFGVNAARNLSVDAFPDVTNVQVQIATEAPGRSPAWPPRCTSCGCCWRAATCGSRVRPGSCRIR